ncbi:MAG: hypothetical protein JHC31_14700 [Sulfurihydrogenibium sp.]|nr:hypothetical protein [Sulfurihydrogenibium sp.]
MSKSFDRFVHYYMNNRSNNYAVYSDFIIYDELYLDFLDYPRENYYHNFKYFTKHAIKNSKIPELIALFHFKYCHSTEVNVYKGKTIHQIISPYKERSRTISYPVDRLYNFFVTITFRSPFTADNFDALSVVAFNDYLNEKVKKGFKRWRDNVRRHYYLQLKREFYNMDPAILETFFGYIPTTEELNKYINQEATRLTRETFYYFRVYETHKSNVIHCHALVQIPQFMCDMDFQALIHLVASWFETEPNGVELDRIHYNRKGNGTNAVKRYILKYMNKQFQLDNLVYTDKSENERVYLLRTSAFVMNFIPRVISYSRGTKVKKFKPFSSYTLKEAPEDLPDDFIHRECFLLDEPIQAVEYEEVKLFVDRLETIYQKRERTRLENERKRTEAIRILQTYLEDDLIVATNLDRIMWAIDWLRFDDEYYVLSQSATFKLNEDLEYVEEAVDF